MNPKSRRRALRVLLIAGALAGAASPAFAQSVGGNIGTFFQNLIDLLNNNVIRSLAIIAVIVCGVSAMFGRLDWHRAGTVVIGIIVIFGAATIVDLITGGSGGGIT